MNVRTEKRRETEWDKLVKECGFNTYQKLKVRNYLDDAVKKSMAEVQDSMTMAFILSMRHILNLGVGKNSTRIKKVLEECKNLVEEAYGHNCIENGKEVYDGTGAYRLHIWCENLGVEYKMHI